MKNRRVVAFLLVVLVALPIAWSCFLSQEPTNYCREKQRYFSDREYIKIAVSLEAASGDMKNIELRHKTIERGIEIEPVDADVEKFLSAHPDCCRVYKKEKVAFLEKWFAKYPVTVHVVYDTGVKSAFGGKTIFYEAYVEMNECGKTGPIVRGSI